MLQMTITDDRETLDRLSLAVNGAPFPGRTGFVLLSEGEPIGVAYATASPALACIRFVGVVPSKRKRGYGDFFTRVLLDHFSRVSAAIEAESDAPYFLQFGFQLTPEGRMRLNSDDLFFPKPCQQAKPQ